MSALVNAIRILRRVAAADRDLSLSEVARDVGLSKSNTHRILATLLKEGLLARDTASGHYRLGLSLFELGVAAVGRVQIDQVTGPYLSQLARATGETVMVGVLDGADVVYIQKIESQQALRIATRIGGRLPAHATATGKALLAHQPVAAAEAAIHRGLSALTAHTITDPARFRQELETVHRTGYAVCDQEPELGVRAVSAPFFSYQSVVAAITICAPVQRCPRYKFAALGALAKQAACRISQELGASARTRSPPGSTTDGSQNNRQGRNSAWPGFD